ncbi:mucin-5AC-like [Mya arenaria]|uniref:mucin-5AC-like n=1 Tax=Mya arenaria TaxID=6604 RepID=UPI0022E2480A|nr:mucin-5AC-like [Mya arenaria]
MPSFRTTRWIVVSTLISLCYSIEETPSSAQNNTPPDTKPKAKASSITTADAISMDSIPTFDFSKTNGKKTTDAPVDTCSSEDVCQTMRGVCHNGTCKPNKCSGFTCICEAGHTGQLCDKKVNGDTTLPAETTPSSNGKHHVNGVVHPNLITGKTDKETIVLNDSKAVPVSDVNSDEENSNQTITGPDKLGTVRNKSLTITSDTTGPSTLANGKNEQTNIIDQNIQNAQPTTEAPVESKNPRKTTMSDGSYRKGPESTKHSDNSPVDAHITNQKVKTNAPSLIQPKSDVVTIPTTVVETSVNKVETPPEVKASIIKQTDTIAQQTTTTTDSISTAVEKPAAGGHDKLISMVQSSEFVEKPSEVSNINDLGTASIKKEKLVGTVRIGNHDVPVLLEEQPEVLKSDKSNSQKSKTEEPSAGSASSLSKTQQKSAIHTNKGQDLMSNKTMESNTASKFGHDETNTSTPKPASEPQPIETKQTIDTTALLQLLNILGSPNIAETVKAVKIEIITKSNTTDRNSNVTAKDAELSVSTTQSPP